MHAEVRLARENIDHNMFVQWVEIPFFREHRNSRKCSSTGILYFRGHIDEGATKARVILQSDVGKYSCVEVVQNTIDRARV